MKITYLTLEAYHALNAAMNYRHWGRYAAMRYAQKHNVVGLYRLARQLESMKGV